MFADEAAWTVELEACEQRLAAISDFAGTLHQGPGRWADYIEARDALWKPLMQVMMWASLQTSTDATDEPAQARAGRTYGLLARAAAATAFENPELLAIGIDTLREWVAADPRLAAQAHAVEQLARRGPHLRSAEVESLFGLASEPLGAANQAYGMLTNTELDLGQAVDADGEAHEVAQGSIGRLLASPDRSLRESAWRGYADAYLAKKRTLAACLGGAVKRDVFFMRARGYDSSLSASTESGFIPPEVCRGMLEVYRENLPTWHRYWRLRERALGLDAIKPWDVKAPLSTDPPRIEYEEAVAWIVEGVAPLGPDYAETVRRGALEGRWVDVLPNRGKRQGAFSAGTPGTPPYILMSWTDDVFSLSTLAHELGHSMHSWLSHRAQPLSYSRYGMFLAETASNLTQALVRHWMLEHHAGNEAMELAILEEAMANFYRYFFVMPALARFEITMHERAERGQPIGADTLTGLMADILEEGYGDAMPFGEHRDRMGITWAQFPHLYSNFYVYQYATGISAANALAARLLGGETGARGDVLGFLSAGSSDFPLPVLERAGVDMRDRAPVDAAFAAMGGVVDRLEALLERRGGALTRP
jgi:oligoendopeptidase F